MIVVEPRLHEIFRELPITPLPVYAWGDLQHLDKWVMKKPNTYPLIYQTSKEEIQDLKHREVTTTWEAVIATQNVNTSLFNDERWKLAFENVLNPIAVRIAEGFTRCSFINWDQKVRIKRFGNYGQDNKHFTVDIWDAISFQATITMNTRLHTPINWKNL